MKRFFFLCGMTLCSLFAGGALLTADESAETITLAENGVTPYVITLPENPSAVQKSAADELAKYLGEITGAEFPILPESAAAPGTKQLAIGPSKITDALLADQGGERDDYPYDAVRIVPCGESVVLTGHPTRGMLYAVYTFLENDLGCRWWTADESTIPRDPSGVVRVTPVDYAPKLIYRESYYKGLIGPENADFALKMKCNGNSCEIPDRFGGHHRYQFTGHSYYTLIPPDKYFIDHPEWFSEIDGVRKIGPRAKLSGELIEKLSPQQISVDGTQLCLTNEEMIREMAKNAIEVLRTNPNATIISISQNDWYGCCTCEQCRAVDRREGSHAGTMIRFINRMAEEIEKVYPDIYVDTLAYQYSRKPPKLTRARDNVIVRLCSIECSFAQPLSGPQNSPFADDLKGWTEKAPNLFVWDYVTNFMNYLLPHPNYRVWKENINYYIDRHTIGLFEQGVYDLPRGDFVELRAWVLAKLLWNPKEDQQGLIDEFVAGYYAPQLVPIYREYFNLLSDACEKSGAFLNIFRANVTDWLDLDTLAAATGLMDRAEETARRLAEEDPRYAPLPEKVSRDRIGLDLVWAMNGRFYRREAQLFGKPYPGPTDPAAAAGELFDRYEAGGVREYGEWTTEGQYEGFKESILAQYDRQPPADIPERFKDIPADRLFVIEEYGLNLTRINNALMFLENDPAAANGRALRLPGTDIYWPFTITEGGCLRLMRELNRGRDPTVHAYLSVRADSPADDAVALTAGWRAVSTDQDLCARPIKVSEIKGSRYTLIDVGSFTPDSETCFQITPPKTTEVDNVWIDRVIFVLE
ncbi:MAG: DUF4838 domain-containing protein [Thermoguttaceae bacterium]|nr:DUF4838 domain-containing protein [Thermoguttaceae bacterium]